MPDSAATHCRDVTESGDGDLMSSVEPYASDPCQLAFLTEALVCSLTVTTETVPAHVKRWPTPPFLAHLPSRGCVVLVVTRMRYAAFQICLFTDAASPEHRHSCDFVHPTERTIARNILYKVGVADPDRMLCDLIRQVSEQVDAETDFCEPPHLWQSLEIRLRRRHADAPGMIRSVAAVAA